MADEDPRQHLLDIVRDFDIAMFCTRDVDGLTHGRPMAIVDLEEDGDLVFCSGLDSTKIAEIEIDPRVTLMLQNSSKWVTLSGIAALDRDRGRIRRLWQDDWTRWFPDGPDDPNLCLIDVEVTGGEYWDSSATAGLRFAVNAAKGYVRDDAPDRQGVDAGAKFVF